MHAPDMIALGVIIVLGTREQITRLEGLVRGEEVGEGP